MNISQQRRNSITRAYGFRVINTTTKALTNEELAFEVSIRKSLLDCIGMTDSKTPTRSVSPQSVRSFSSRQRG